MTSKRVTGKKHMDYLTIELKNKIFTEWWVWTSNRRNGSQSFTFGETFNSVELLLDWT